ncbi:MAG: MFS transporter [Clostridia bacterium]|nr:MFS transporter [Clostridia bacterium]
MRTEQTRLDESAELRRVNAQLRELVDVDRRVLSRKQTLGYMFLDGSRGFNIDGHKDLFNDSILKISLKLQSGYNIFAGVWDIVDDFIVSAIVEKTRTRWGKFVPYIFVGGLPFALIATLYWLLPLLFSPEHINDFSYLPKFFAYALVDMALEFLGNIRNVSIDGYLSTITPYPSDRRRLLAVSSYFSIIYSRLPDIAVEFMLDFIKNGFVKSAKSRTTDQMIRRSMMIVGPTTAILAGLVFTWYTTIAKERVHQKIERPRIRDSLRVVMTNRPILIYMISNALGSFGTGLTTNDYYRQVLNWTTFETFAGIPSFFFQPIGFANYNRLARRFSTRTLFMVGQTFAKSFYIPLFFYGIFIKDKKGLYFFQNRWAMLPVTALWEILYAIMWGVRSISINEMRNECNDYLEWKYGARSEATLSAASAFITKIPARINGILQPKYKQWVGYDQTAYTEGRQQPLRAQKWIFAMATLFPAIIVISSMIPMFWFNIDKNTRDKMYRELNERRVAVAEMIKREADADEAESV